MRQDPERCHGLGQTGPEVTRSPRPTAPGRVPDSLPPCPPGLAGFVTRVRPAHARAGSDRRSEAIGAFVQVRGMWAGAL
jgi:hypothetical protein